MAYSKHFAEITAVEKIRGLIEGYNSVENTFAKKALYDAICSAAHHALGQFFNTGVVRYSRFGSEIEEKRVSYFVGEVHDRGQGRSEFEKDYEWFIDLATCEISGGHL